ncbi:hypothetical protein [Actinoalloteichus caeruleus]|uniref:hypothetical protein n=1 Tax=Actinoalloteichus cyanogriseus TaxID=2893586 RepID=UPI0012DCCAB7|nr:hypothetical protein [Actinoalloteichus caeruleus]
MTALAGSLPRPLSDDVSTGRIRAHQQHADSVVTLYRRPRPPDDEKVAALVTMHRRGCVRWARSIQVRRYGGRSPAGTDWAHGGIPVSSINWIRGFLLLYSWNSK